MGLNDRMIRVFAGSEITLNLLSTGLQEAGIQSNVITGSDQSNLGGFSAGTPYSVDLYILNSDLEKAKPIVDAFIEVNGM